MQACLQRYEASKMFIKIVFEKLRLRENINYYFYEILISIFQRSVFKPYAYYFMQATPSCYAYKVLFKNMFDLGNLLITILND
jgi:hypothetical protein